MSSKRESQGLVRWRDVRRLAELLAGGLAAAVIPSRFDDAVVEALKYIHPVCTAKRRAELAGHLAKVLGPEACHDWDGLAAEHGRVVVEEAWARLRGIASKRWRPSIEFEGEQRLRSGLDAGRGAVIWSARFSSENVLKQGFHQAGLPLVRLGFAEHGASGSRTTVGVSVISPLYLRAEMPYLANRIVIPINGPDGDWNSLGYLRDVRDHLRRNACVSIYSGPIGRQAIDVPFLTSRRKFATGAPSLAWIENSSLFPAHVIRTGRFRYRVVVDEPIVVDRSLARKEFARRAVLEFAARMERLVKQFPADWLDWEEWKNINPR